MSQKNTLNYPMKRFLIDRKHLQKIIIIIIFGIMIIIPYVYTTNNIPLPACAFKSITAHSCPTCGISRSYFAMAHGEFVESLNYNFMGTLLYILSIAVIFRQIINLIRGKEIRIKFKTRVIKVVIIVILCSWITFWMVRLFTETGKLI